MKSNRIMRLLAILGALALILAACGDGDTADTTEATQAPETTEAPETTGRPGDNRGPGDNGGPGDNRGANGSARARSAGCGNRCSWRPH